jgi:hypothetical protein
MLKLGISLVEMFIYLNKNVYQISNDQSHVMLVLSNSAVNQTCLPVYHTFLTPLTCTLTRRCEIYTKVWTTHHRNLLYSSTPQPWALTPLNWNHSTLSHLLNHWVLQCHHAPSACIYTAPYHLRDINIIPHWDLQDLCTFSTVNFYNGCLSN